MKDDAKPTFTDVAALIAKGPPPEWLVLGLDYFGNFVRDKPFSRAERKQTQTIIKRMYDSALYLRKNLLLFRYLVPGQTAAPKDVALALVVLPRIEKLLAMSMDALKPPSGGGKEPNQPRKQCAAVVVEAWRVVHGKPEPESDKLWTACNDYWRACGGEYRGSDVDTWRQDCRDAVANNHEWIRQTLSVLKTGCN
jgi:hypothetical protein